MKSLYCSKCVDLVRLYTEPRQCRCGSSSGALGTDGKSLTVWGPYSFVVEFSSHEFAQLADEAKRPGRQGEGRYWFARRVVAAGKVRA